MSDTELVPVKFLKQWRAYNNGDVAGFDEGVAKKLVDGGVAEHHKAGKAASRATQSAKSAGQGQQANKAAAPAAPASGAAATGEAGRPGSDDGEDFRP